MGSFKEIARSHLAQGRISGVDAMFYFWILLPLRLGLVSTAPQTATVIGDDLAARNVDLDDFDAAEDFDTPYVPAEDFGSLITETEEAQSAEDFDTPYVPAEDFGSLISETEEAKPTAPNSDARVSETATFPSQNSSSGYVNETRTILLADNETIITLNMAVKNRTPMVGQVSNIIENPAVIEKVINAVAFNLEVADSKEREAIENSIRTAFHHMGGGNSSTKDFFKKKKPSLRVTKLGEKTENERMTEGQPSVPDHSGSSLAAGATESLEDSEVES